LRPCDVPLLDVHQSADGDRLYLNGL